MLKIILLINLLPFIQPNESKRIEVTPRPKTLLEHKQGVREYNCLNLPTLIEIGKRVQLDFSVKHDLYFYLPLDQFGYYEENSITVSIQQNEEEQPVTPTIYSKDFQLTVPIAEYDEYVPKTKEESIFPVINKDNTNYVLYFKKTENKSNVLLINILFITELTKGSLILSQKTQPIDVLYIDSLKEIVIRLEEYVPFRLTFSCFPTKRNMIIYSSHIDIQTIYIGTILTEKLSINDNLVETELYAIQYNSWDIATVEYFGKEGTYIIYVEPVTLPLYFLYNKRNYEQAYYQLEDIGKIYYFIETTNTSVENTSLVIKDQYGKYEYYFKEKIIIQRGLLSLLPNAEDTSTGLEKLQTRYSITGVKVISPGRIEMIIQPMEGLTIEFKDYIKYNTIFSKGNTYIITLLEPTLNKALNLEISTLVIEDPNAQIIIEINGEKATLTQDSKIQIKSKEIKAITINHLISNSALTFKLISLSSPFVEITTDTNEIRSQNVILKLMNDNISIYELKLGKTLEFNYEIGLGEIDLIVTASHSITSIENEVCLSFSNPKTKYGQIPQDNFYYLTMSFKAENLPIPLTINTVNQPTYPSIEINTLQMIDTETKSSLIESDDYNTDQMKYLFILASPCSVHRSQKIILSDENNNEIQSFSVENKLSHITQSNLHIPLFLEYIDNEMTSDGFTSFINYNYLTMNQIEAMDMLITAKDCSISYSDNKIKWTKPAELDLDYIVYIVESGKNTSTMDDECYLTTLEGNKTNKNEFELNINDNNKYVIGIRAINNIIMTFSITFNPIEINSKKSLLWLWITISVIAITILSIVLVIIFGKKKSDQTKRITGSLIPLEQSSEIIEVN